MTRQNQIDVKTVFISVCLLFAFLGCERTPRVRLVKDDDRTFHFQWAEPLIEERIILVRYSGVFSDYNLEIPWEKELLVYFPAGSVVSAQLHRQSAMRHTSVVNIENRLVKIRDSNLDSVEICPAHLRETVLPADVYEIGILPADGFEIGEREFFRLRGERILREHPFFREYHVDQPSRLTFEE